MQYPPNPYDNSGQTTHWQPTTPNYPPYGQYPPQVPPPPKKPLAHQRFTAWYGRMWRKSKFLTGCLTLIVAFLLCGLCSGITNANSHNNQAVTDATTPTVTIAPTKAALVSHIATPTVKPTVAPTPTPVPPTPTPIPQQVQPTSPPAPTQPPAPTCGGTVVDGVCYSFDSTGGSQEYNPVPDFCTVFSCITSFYSGTSYVVQCNDGMYSKSGGRTGSCSRHGGEGATLYRH